ncbi:MAG: metallophosphoesterase family protein [Thermoplasmatota archaeon]
MRGAVISDVHGNPWALEAVLSELDHVDALFVLGDLVGIGPRPSEALDMLKKDRRVRKVMGNHDHNTLFGTELGPTDIVPRRPHHDWVRSRLSSSQIEYLGGPMELRVEDGVEAVFMHRHPLDCGSKVPYFDEPRPEVLDRFYSDVKGDILFFGHTHFPLDITGNTGRRYVNPGAVGAQNEGKASYVVFETENGPVSVTRKEAPYDVQAVVEEILDERMPYHRFIVSHFF